MRVLKNWLNAFMVVGRDKNNKYHYFQLLKEIDGTFDLEEVTKKEMEDYYNKIKHTNVITRSGISFIYMTVLGKPQDYIKNEAIENVTLELLEKNHVNTEKLKALEIY